MSSPATSSSKRLIVTLLLAAAVGTAGNLIWTYLNEPLTDQDVTTGAASTEPDAPAVATPAPSGATAALPPAVEPAPPYVFAPPQAPDVGFRRGSRESYGHRAGLHKVRADLNLSASAALVIDQETGQVLLRKNGDAVLPIASLTKLMTALVVIQARLPMDEPLTITEDDIDGERHSRSRLRVGTSLPRGEALQLALMSSENRAAHMLGRTFPGGPQAFAQAMNRKAAALGMKKTTYVDPTGLSNGNQSTAQDLALLAAAASKEPLLAQYSTTRQHLLAMDSGRTLVYNNSNPLLKNDKWDISLQKTGYIIEAGWCVVMNTRIDGHNLLVVLLDAAGKSSRLSDAERIRRWVDSRAGPVSTGTVPADPRPDPVVEGRALVTAMQQRGLRMTDKLALLGPP